VGTGALVFQVELGSDTTQLAVVALQFSLKESLVLKTNAENNPARVSDTTWNRVADDKVITDIIIHCQYNVLCSVTCKFSKHHTLSRKSRPWSKTGECGGCIINALIRIRGFYAVGNRITK